MRKQPLLSLGIGLLALLRPLMVAQPVPHHFNDVARATDGTVTLTLNGRVSGLISGLSTTISNQVVQMFDLYPVEVSENLTDWSVLDWIRRGNDDPTPLLFQDTESPAFDKRFYRTDSDFFLTPLPATTGPFRVGTASRILTDASRQNRYGIPNNSSFMCTLWYPTELPSAGSRPKPYTDSAVAADRNWYSFWGWPVAWTDVLSQAVVQAVLDAPLTSGTDRFPVVLHSHGFSCDRTLNSYCAMELASHGYIIAAVDHIDCHATVFPDERGSRYVYPNMGNINASLLSSRTQDLAFLVDALVELDTNDPILGGRLDLERIGVMGHSVGAGTAAETCRRDDRVKCAALLDPFLLFGFGFNPTLNSQGLQKPFLTMNRKIMDHSNLLYDATGESQRLYTLAAQDACWVKLANSDHFTFSDWAWIVQMTPDSRLASTAINACLVWFFDTYLKDGTSEFPTHGEIIDVRRK